jgi:hypothetical protein
LPHPAATPIRGASVDPPPNPYSGSRFPLHGGTPPTFRGATSFPSGNRLSHDRDVQPDAGVHQGRLCPRPRDTSSYVPGDPPA